MLGIFVCTIAHAAFCSSSSSKSDTAANVNRSHISINITLFNIALCSAASTDCWARHQRPCWQCELMMSLSIIIAMSVWLNCSKLCFDCYVASPSTDVQVTRLLSYWYIIALCSSNLFLQWFGGKYGKYTNYLTRLPVLPSPTDLCVNNADDGCPFHSY